jgi:hypothetical protein
MPAKLEGVEFRMIPNPLSSTRKSVQIDVSSLVSPPSRAFGADYILNFDGVVREDLNR